ncbi:MAG: sigma 54-interacting transcriptional regulator [Proteobacteria bacterium]|nr:sigma 54-interacting transcriptional regulator [Pseudomonadota bacterium]
MVGLDTPIKVDVRVIAATNVNLIEKVRAGNFREDLYYRLKVVEINLPPLRDRNGGIPLLAYHFLSLFRDQLKRNIHGISDQAMNALSCYYWPGNVRELRHMIERACVLCEGPIISLKHFPEEIRSQQMQQNTIPDLTSDHTSEQAPQSTTAVNTRLLLPYISEKDELIDAMKRARGNKSKAARMLNVNRSTLYRKMQRLGIQEDEFMEHSVQNTPSKI